MVVGEADDVVVVGAELAKLVVDKVDADVVVELNWTTALDAEAVGDTAPDSEVDDEARAIKAVWLMSQRTNVFEAL